MNFLFRNRSILVKPVLDKDILVKNDSEDSVIDPFLGPRVAVAYAEVFKDVVTHTAVTVGVVFITCKIVGRLTR